MSRKTRQEIIERYGNQPDVLVLGGDTAALGDARSIRQQRRGGIAALEVEPPHRLAHGAVVALETQVRLVDLEEIVEHAPAADDLDFWHCGSLGSSSGCTASLPQLVHRSMVGSERR